MGIGIGRRQFLSALGGAAGLAWPLAGQAQQPALPVVGVLNNASTQEKQDLLAAFLLSLREAGFVDGQNITIEYRDANNQIERLPALASEFVRQQVAVIVASSTSSGLAAKAATATIPIVFVGGADPAEFGFTGNLNRPGGNFTGVSFLNEATTAKRLEVMHEVVPKAVLFGLLVDPTVAQTERDIRDGMDAARVFGLELRVLNASNEREIDAAFATLVQWQVGGLLIDGGGYFTFQSDRLAGLAARYKVPAIFNVRDFPAAGGLMSYGSETVDAYRMVGNYVGRILKGEKPGDLPIQQATKVTLTINLRTAKALGLTVPLTLLGRADEVIE